MTPARFVTMRVHPVVATVAEMLMARMEEEPPYRLVKPDCSSLFDISRWLWQWHAEPSQTLSSWPSEGERLSVARRLRFARWLVERGKVSDR